MHHPRDRITHTTAFVTPVVEQWLEREKKTTTQRLCNNSRFTVNKTCEELVKKSIDVALFMFLVN